MMQHHPSILAFLVGSDYWPDDRATNIYLDALAGFNWAAPIIASASQRGFPQQLGNGGMQMAGPYDWVPPNYWYDPQLRLGAAAGFGSELGAGVGTPELGSLRKFLSSSDLDDLWKPETANNGLYHMSTNVSSFYTRQIYNDALYARYGAPTSLDDYLLKAQMMDYEATRAQFEAYSSRWSKELSRPATGAIYWMLNIAWPSLHWNLFDYYLHPGGSYFGIKAALGSLQTVTYNYEEKSIYLVDRRLHASSSASETSMRQVAIDVITLNGSSIVSRSVTTTMDLNSSKNVTTIPEIGNITDVAFLRLKLQNASNETLSRNVYWLAPHFDVMDWDNSTWYSTPVTSYSNFQSLSSLPNADVAVHVDREKLTLENKSTIPAVFVRLNLVDEMGDDVVPVMWSENYVTLFPGEKVSVAVGVGANKDLGGMLVEVSGRNVLAQKVSMGYGKRDRALVAQ